MGVPLKRGELYEKANKVEQFVEGRPGVVVVRVGDKVVVKKLKPEDRPEDLPF